MQENWQKTEKTGEGEERKVKERNGGDGCKKKTLGKMREEKKINGQKWVGGRETATKRSIERQLQEDQETSCPRRPERMHGPPSQASKDQNTHLTLDSPQVGVPT